MSKENLFVRFPFGKHPSFYTGFGETLKNKFNVNFNFNKKYQDPEDDDEQMEMDKWDIEDQNLVSMEESKDHSDIDDESELIWKENYAGQKLGLEIKNILLKDNIRPDFIPILLPKNRKHSFYTGLGTQFEQAFKYTRIEVSQIGDVPCCGLKDVPLDEEAMVAYLQGSLVAIDIAYIILFKKHRLYYNAVNSRNF